jgi:hypothetical protein
MESETIAQLKLIDTQIQRIKQAALELKDHSQGIQALDCNVDRILASTKMLEINFGDLLDLV